ncbi:MAG: hypothetical protein JWN45_3446 [Acidobacteriaceae bacterium]|jgi:hypothetical protein|nr:hypothetical protein [Acidobacteriaceae bacterium]
MASHVNAVVAHETQAEISYLAAAISVSWYRSLYAYNTAIKGAATSTPQKGQSIPSTIGARIDAQMARRFLMMYC